MESTGDQMIPLLYKWPVPQALMSSLTSAYIKSWTNSQGSGDLRCHNAHVTSLCCFVALCKLILSMEVLCWIVLLLICGLVACYTSGTADMLLRYISLPGGDEGSVCVPWRKFEYEDISIGIFIVKMRQWWDRLMYTRENHLTVYTTYLYQIRQRGAEGRVHFSIKKASHQYRNCHYKDKMVS